MKKVYKPGIRFIICTDGRIYNKFLDVEDLTVFRYRNAVINLLPSNVRILKTLLLFYF